MNADAMRRDCVAQARRQFQSFCRDIDSRNAKPRYRIVDVPLTFIINSGCCHHNILYTLPCTKCGRKVE